MLCHSTSSQTDTTGAAGSLDGLAAPASSHGGVVWKARCPSKVSRAPASAPVHPFHGAGGETEGPRTSCTAAGSETSPTTSPFRTASFGVGPDPANAAIAT